MGRNYYSVRISSYFLNEIVKKLGVFSLLLVAVSTTSFSLNGLANIDQDFEIEQFIHRQIDRAKLEIRRDVLSNNIIKNTRHKREFSQSMNVSWNKVWESERYETGTKEITDSDLNQVFLIFGRTLGSVEKSEKYENGILTKNILSVADDKITFSKMFKWQFMRFILYGVKSGESFLYMSTIKDYGEFKFHQKIYHPSSKGNHPVDGEFFIHGEQLYLFLIYGTDSHQKVNSVLYSWHNTYFDVEIQDLFTEGAVGVCSFNYGSSVIIVIIQSLNETEETKKISSLVLKFSRKSKGRSKLEKIQLLPTKKPERIINFHAFDDEFILICEKQSPVYIYRWEGGEFIEWSGTSQMHDCENVIPGYIADYTLLFLKEYGQRIINVYWMAWMDVARVQFIPFSGEILFFSVEGSKLIAAEKIEDSMKIIITDLAVETVPLKGPPEPSDSLPACFSDLEKELGGAKDKLTSFSKDFSHLLFVDKLTVIEGQVRVSDPDGSVTVKNGSVSTVSDDYSLNSSVGVIMHDLAQLFNESFGFLQKLKRDNEIKNNSLFIFKEDLYIDELQINSATAKSVNDHVIETSKLISLSKDQYLKNVRAKSIYVSSLLTDQVKNKNVSDLIVDTSAAEWGESVTVSDLICYNLVFTETPIINNINVNDIVRKNNSNAFVSGEKTIGKTKAEKISTGNINKMPFDEWFRDYLVPTSESLRVSGFTINDNAKIDELNVKYIDGIEVDSFFNNAFVNGLDSVVNGNLYFEKGFEAKKLKTSALNNFYENVNYDFPVGRALHGGSDNFQVKRADGKKLQRSTHVYKKKLFVHGCMQVNQIMFEKCHLVIGNKTLAINSLDKEFWTHSTLQVIPRAVKFNDTVRIEGDLSLNNINEINTNDLINIGHTDKIDSSLFFQSVTVNGNVTTKKSKVERLNDLFPASELIKNLLLDEGENEKTKNNATNDKDSFTKQKIIIRGNLMVGGNIRTDKINKAYTTKSYESLSANDYREENLEFSNITAKDIKLQKLNGIQFEKIIHFNSDKAQRRVIDKLLVKGDITFAGMNVNYINSVSVNETFPKIVNGSKYNRIKGKKTFTSSVVIENDLKTDAVNNITIEDILGNYLSKSKSQSISSECYLKNISIDTLETKFVSGIDTSLFIDTEHDEEIIIRSGKINFENLFVSGNISSPRNSVGRHLSENYKPLIFEKSNMSWETMFVAGNSSWDAQDKNDKGRLQMLFDNAVTLDGKQRITGSVTFLQNVIADNIYTNESNIAYMMSDAVLKNKSNQIITGEKIFVKSVYCLNASVLREALIETVNGVNITYMNEHLIRKNSENIITGHKTFENGFSAFNFFVEGNVNGISTKNIVLLTDTYKHLPPTTFKNLEVINNINFKTINEINLQKFLSERILVKQGEGYEQKMIEGDIIFKGDVTLMGDSYLQLLNSIIINDVLLTNDAPSNKIDVVKGCKTFNKSLNIEGKLKCDFINNKNISYLYNSCIAADKNTTINGNIKFGGETIMIDLIHGTSFVVDNSKLNFLDESKKLPGDFIKRLLKIN